MASADRIGQTVMPNVRAKLTHAACKTGRAVQREHSRCAAGFASRVGAA